VSEAVEVTLLAQESCAYCEAAKEIWPGSGSSTAGVREPNLACGGAPGHRRRRRVHPGHTARRRAIQLLSAV